MRIFLLVAALHVGVAAHAQENAKPVFGAPIKLAPTPTANPAPDGMAAKPAVGAGAPSVTSAPAAVPTPATAITALPTIAPSPVVVEMWNVFARDLTLSNTLTRWGLPSGHQVLWAAAKDLPAMNALYKGSFEEAVEALMKDTRHSGYPVHACLYTNKVVRVLHATQACNQ